jgi:LCP family protein required for cell wall assembly
MNELTANTLDVAVLNSANLQLARDTDEHFDSTFTIIGTFTIRVPNSTATPSQVNANQPFAVYISGIDTYGNISTVSRSDVNILAIVDPAKRHLVLINTPRDYYVQLHGTIGSKDKLTHAGIYGVDMSRQTLEDLYDIDIPYYIRVNFSSLMAIVDTIGGVSVYSDYAFGQFHVGRNELNGKQALQFSRERYSFTEGDRQRGRNQQRVIEAIVSKLSSPSVLVNYSSVLSTTLKLRF